MERWLLIRQNPYDELWKGLKTAKTSLWRVSSVKWGNLDWKRLALGIIKRFLSRAMTLGNENQYFKV